MPTDPLVPRHNNNGSRNCWTELAVVALIALCVSVIYGARLGAQPVVGEETRWGTGAREMLATGDWIVPRQQGRVFPERPPMTMWAMAAVGWLRGGVDPIAIRLPSVIAVVLTSLLVYAYARTLISRTTAVAAALIYASMGQVLQIGRLGESEALFTLLVSASLLLWHLGYSRQWGRLSTWCIGFGFAALAALVKGPQAPIYFVAITGVYLMVQRDWRYLLNWQYAVAACLFATIIAAWQIPFYLATDWPTVVATWSGLAGDRLHLSGLARHVVTYPLETFVCLLPWSPLLVALAKRETRILLAEKRDVTTFLYTALLVAYPTVWTAAGARGRYFMPLYPIAAILIGLIIERCAAAAPAMYPHRAWRQFLLLTGTLITVAGLVVGFNGMLPDDAADWLHQPRWFSLIVGIVATFAVYVILLCYKRKIHLAPIAAVAAITAFVGVAFAGIMININTARWNDPTSAVASFKSRLPNAAALSSFSPIEHRFAYFYGSPIEELDWPREVSDLPPGVDYFCFMRYAGDTAERRAAGRGRTWTTTLGTLPFAWEEIATICAERRVVPGAPHVVLARVVRPLRAEITDVTVPRNLTAQRPASQHR